MRCWAYIDGFNLYHGACKRLSCKWVNLLDLCQSLRPNDTVERVKYFTAMVEQRAGAPDQRRNQRTYWRALKTLGCVERIEGYFTRWEKYMPLCSSVYALEAQEAAGVDVCGQKPKMAQVLRCEEKGSDVNLAAHLVHDANQRDDTKTFDVALVITTDEDLAGAINLVTKDVGKPVYLCRPNPTARTRRLDQAATGAFDLSVKLLRAAVFEDQLIDSRGTIIKPATW
ncbi:MAG: NYN domain-containing protein [Armatimonadia bacterium]